MTIFEIIPTSDHGFSSILGTCAAGLAGFARYSALKALFSRLPSLCQFKISEIFRLSEIFRERFWYTQAASPPKFILYAVLSAVGPGRRFVANAEHHYFDNY